jgi:hypothetical protein
MAEDLDLKKAAQVCGEKRADLIPSHSGQAAAKGGAPRLMSGETTIDNAPSIFFIMFVLYSFYGHRRSQPNSQLHLGHSR